MNCQIIILAAGNGKRMASNLPKVMHKVGDKPTIERVLNNAREVTNDIILVHSHQLLQHISPYQSICKFILQDKPLGTAHAVYTALPKIDNNKPTVVVYGDNPFLTNNIISDLLTHLTSNNLAINTLCFKCNNPNQYGRIVTDKNGDFSKIVEFKDATPDELLITICNSGAMAFKSGVLQKYIQLVVDEHINCNNNSEAYLTDIVRVAKNKNEKVSFFLSSNHNLVVGINTQKELIDANTSFHNLRKIG